MSDLLPLPGWAGPHLRRLVPRTANHRAGSRIARKLPALDAFHNVSVDCDATSRVEIAESPATFSPNKICFDDGDHWNQLGVDFRFGVRSRGSTPPSAGIA